MREQFLPCTSSTVLCKREYAFLLALCGVWVKPRCFSAGEGLHGGAGKHHLYALAFCFYAILVLVGLLIIGSHSNSSICHIGVFLITAAAYANVLVATIHQANNIRVQWEQAYYRCHTSRFWWHRRHERHRIRPVCIILPAGMRRGDRKQSADRLHSVH